MPIKAAKAPEPKKSVSPSVALTKAKTQRTMGFGFGEPVVEKKGRGRPPLNKSLTTVSPKLSAKISSSKVEVKSTRSSKISEPAIKVARNNPFGFGEIEETVAVVAAPQVREKPFFKKRDLKAERKHTAVAPVAAVKEEPKKSNKF